MNSNDSVSPSPKSPKRQKRGHDKGSVMPMYPQRRDGIRTKHQNDEIRIDHIPNKSKGLKYIRKLITNPTARYIKVLGSASNNENIFKSLIGMGFEAQGVNPFLLNHATDIYYNNVPDVQVRNKIIGSLSRADHFTYNTQMPQLSKGLKFAILMRGGRVKHHPKTSQDKLKKLAEIALHSNNVGKRSNALRLVSERPRNVATMSPGSAERYILKHLLSGRYNPPPGFKKFHETKDTDPRSLIGGKKFSHRIIKRADGVDNSVYNAVVASLPPVNLSNKNGVLNDSRLLAIVKKNKKNARFTANSDEITAATANMAFTTGKRIGEGGYGETRMHTLDDGTMVIIKKFFGDTSYDRIFSAETEQRAHMRAWEIEGLRKYITKPLKTQILPHGDKAMTVQLFAGNPDEKVHTLRKIFFGLDLSLPHFSRAQFASILQDIRAFIRIMKANHIRHNDMNLDNILVRSKDDTYLGIVVIDWGLSWMPPTANKRPIYAFEEYWTNEIRTPMQRNLDFHPRQVLNARKQLGNTLNIRPIISSSNGISSTRSNSNLSARSINSNGGSSARSTASNSRRRIPSSQDQIRRGRARTRPFREPKVPSIRRHSR
jgi:hypothetical protein